MISLLGCLHSCIVLAPAAFQGPCSHDQDTLVKARTLSQGGVNCMTGVTLFGKTYGSYGKKCPAVVISYPEHRACLGEPARGYRCVESGFAMITMSRCTCLHLGNAEWGISFDSCLCSAPVTVGGVSDAQTLACKGNH
jgi:hypothetical protein